MSTSGTDTSLEVAIAGPDVNLEAEMRVLPLSAIVASATNPRTVFNLPRLQELAVSIAASGVHQPILVRPLPASRVEETSRANHRGQKWQGYVPPTHEIVAGERRYRASKLAGKTTIPVLIRHLTDDQVLEVQLVENLQRDDLHPMEEAEGYERLCNATGTTKEEIASKVGKSRAYVYARLKLLDLMSSARTAFCEDKIDVSRALVIARIPDHQLQEKALEAATKEDWQGGLDMNFKDFVRWAQQNVMLRLDAARFRITDESLVPEAGACGTCPKRTGAAPDLFADVDSADVCIDPKCFHAKEAAHDQEIVINAEARGVRVIQGTEAKELKSDKWRSIAGFVPLDEELRATLSERDLKTGVALFVDPYENKPVMVVSNSIARKAQAKTAPKQTPKERKVDDERDAERKKVELEMSYQKRWRTKAIAVLAPKVAGMGTEALTPALLRRVLFEVSGADVRCNDETTADALGLTNDWDEELMASSIRSTSDDQVASTIILMLLHGDLIAHGEYRDGKRQIDGSAPVIEELAGTLDVSLDEIKAQVQAEFRAELAEASTAKAAVPAKADSAGKRPRKPKATKAEAAAAIATAFEQAENPNSFQVGQRVRIKTDLRKGTNVFHTAHVEAEVLGPAGDRAWELQPVGMAFTVFADYTEIEAVEDEPFDYSPAVGNSDEAPQYVDAVALVRNEEKASITLIQRHLKVGYNAAARLIELMEANGVVSAVESNGTRRVLDLTAEEGEAS